MGWIEFLNIILDSCSLKIEDPILYHYFSYSTSISSAQTSIYFKLKEGWFFSGIESSMSESSGEGPEILNINHESWY